MTAPDHKDLYRAIGNLEGKLDQLLQESKERNGRHIDLSLRVKSLEKSKNIQVGRDAVILTILAAIGWPSLKAWLGF